MTPRENLIRLLRRKGFDYIPIDFTLCPSLLKEYEERTGGSSDFMEYFQMPWRHVDDMKFDHDPTVFHPYFDDCDLDERTTIDVWGVGHQKGSEAAVHMTRMICPLRECSSLEELKSYPFPDYVNKGDGSHQKAQVEQIHKEGLAACGNMQMTIWEASWYIRSMEELLCDMMGGDEMADYLLDRILEINTARALSYVRAGVDILFLGDDIGMQSSIMMSEELYCEYIKPRYQKLIAMVKAENPELIIFYHSCGYITPFIPHLIDVGVDVLNPIQPECMKFDEIHAKFGDQLSFHGTIGTQTTMPFCTPEEVKTQVTHHLTVAGEKGGLFPAPTHLLEPEVPWENIYAYIDACREFVS